MRDEALSKMKADDTSTLWGHQISNRGLTEGRLLVSYLPSASFIAGEGGGKCTWKMN